MVDVTVMGAGIFGLSVAWACQAKGAQVLVVDPHGVGTGASGGLVGALAPHVPENWNEKKAFQLDSLLLAERFWAEVQQVSGISPGYARLGRLQPIPDTDALALARQREVTAQSLWQGQAEWKIIESSDQHWGPVSPTGFLIHDTLSARVHPRRACTALAAALRTRGAEFSIDATPRGKVVWATGVAGLHDLNASCSRIVGNGVKGQGALLHFNAANLPQLFADTVHIVPHEDGTVAIGSTSERVYEDPTGTDSLLDEVIERAMQAVPVLHGARVVARWAGVRPRTRSRAPMLGKHPLHAGQFIANGGFKIGFGMAPKVGQVMANLMLDGQDDIADVFRPEASF